MVPSFPRRGRNRKLAGIKVLVVDDHDDVRELVRAMLELSGITVHEAASAVEAIRVLQDEDVDLLISDIGMPERDGYSLIREVRASQSEKNAKMPAVALTAFNRQEDRTRALREGFNLHMTKPVEAEHLLDALASLSARSGGS